MPLKSRVSRNQPSAGARDASGPHSESPGPGRPRITPEQLQARIAEYCARYRVAVTDQGLPPFPSGQRETEQHREWMAVYRAHRRVSARSQPGTLDASRARELLTSQHGRCPICHKPLELRHASLDSRDNHPDAALHPRCLELLTLVRELGVETLDRAKARL